MTQESEQRRILDTEKDVSGIGDFQASCDETVINIDQRQNSVRDMLEVLGEVRLLFI